MTLHIETLMVLQNAAQKAELLSQSRHLVITLTMESEGVLVTGVFRSTPLSHGWEVSHMVQWQQIALRKHLLSDTIEEINGRCVDKWRETERAKEDAAYNAAAGKEG